MARYYPHIGIAAGVLLVLLILVGPISEGGEGDRDSIVWKEDWQVIEYLPGSEQAPGPTPDAAGYNQQPALRLIREAGLFADRYFVETPGPDGAFVRRRGGPPVVNIFSDWRRPKLEAYYALSPERRVQAGLQSPEMRLRFFESPGDDPVEMQVGTQTGGAKRFVASNYADHSEQLLIVGSFLFDKFQREPFSFREKRILYYPANSYTRDIRLSAAGADGQLRRLRLSQEQSAQPEGGPRIVYTRHLPGQPSVEIPLNIASPLEAAIKGIMLHRFRDEPEALKWGDADRLWQQAGVDLAEIEVEIEKGESYWIRFRKVPAETADDSSPDADRGNPDSNDAVLMQSSVEPGTDWGRLSAVENVLRQLQVLTQYVTPEPESAPLPESGTQSLPAPGGKTP
jgi:hypothetical protein